MSSFSAHIRGDCLETAKMRKQRKKLLRRAFRKQLGYVRRNLKNIDKLEAYSLTLRQGLGLETMKKLYRQQQYMYDHKTLSVETVSSASASPMSGRLCGARPGQTSSSGSKLAISIVDGLACMEKLTWDNFHEGMTL